MQLTGSHTLAAPIEKVWQMLMDTDILAKIVPGVSRLEKTGENEFEAISEIKLGPVSGKFSGGLTLSDIVEPSTFTLNVSQNSKIGNADASIKINLVALDAQQTEISFDGEAKLSGLLARTGQRVLSGVANTLTKQFFTNFEEEIAS
ncbi:CoxG family protein [Flectobacillus roseus]|uniref:Carbon monoxide dehydrogenase subunit G n=1 Tax=Flectobacillus roseus TaxID=502259 RepID=A0ABT6Y3Z0_9BACT|nr:carbon monoxide dehydrogenase subunit G [Flectobacillus roseus]MDI9858284.1 carbon monoxide dehydrogenase subunit G [Flectobacillus roseus]